MRRRTATIGTIGLIVAACAFTAGGEDELPPLTSPLDVSLPDDPEPKPEPTPKPEPKPAAKPAPPPAAEPHRPVLVVPGLPRPKPRTVAPVTKPSVAEPVVTEEEEAIPKLEPIDDGLPPLVGPADDAVAPEPTVNLTPSLDASDDVLPPLTLEAEPSDAETGPDKPVAKNATPKDVRPAAPRRRLFGLLPPSRNRSESQPAGGSKIEFDPRSDPAADAALKRRVERVIRESAGPHVRSAEVSVVDRSIVIRARADRFFNRRAVKRQLESLPGLAGYNTRVEIVE